MYGNGINNPFMMSNIPYNSMINGNLMMRSIPTMGTSMMRNIPTMSIAPRSGISSLLGGRGIANTGNLFSGLKSFNFGGLLTNASKALGVVKEAIPIVKEVGPMVGNMKQMLKIASIFKDETDTSSNISPKENNRINDKNNIDNNTKENSTITSTITKTNDNEPNFFL